MAEISALGLATAFAAGIISFLSPCVLPLVPAYVSYVGGESLHGVRTESRAHFSAAALSLFFVLGFSVVFIALGASATALGSLLLRYRYEANIIGGVIVIVFGLVMLGLPRRVTFLNRDLRFHPNLRGGHPSGAFLLGLAFGFGWTPCIGPVLGAILTLSAMQNSVSTGMVLLTAYALGLGLPFFVAALFMGNVVGTLKWLRPVGRRLQIAAGVVMIVMGVAMVTGQLSAFAFWLLDTFPALGRIG
jgi:cytochrome c-type biogenesis protein